MSGGRSLARSGLIVMFLNGAAMVAAFAREATIAYYYGASAELDAFWVAFTVPRFLADTMLFALTSALIPVLVGIREKSGDKNAAKLSAPPVTMAVLLSVGLLIVCNAVAPFVIKFLAPGFDEVRTSSAVRLMMMVSPFVVLFGFVSLLKVQQNSLNRFFMPEASRSLMSLAIVGIVSLFASSWGVYALASGFVVGASVAVVANCLTPLRIGWRPRIKLSFSPEVKEFLKRLPSAAAVCGVFYVNVVVGRIFASYLQSGTISLLRYASNVTSVPIALLGGAMATVLLPRFSKAWSADDKEDFRQVLRKSLTLAVFVGSIAAGLLASHADIVVRLLYQRGRFGAEEATVCAVIIGVFSALVPLAPLNAVLSRAAFSSRALLVPILSAAVQTASNIIVCWLLLEPMKELAIPIGAVVSVFLSVLFYSFFISRRLKDVTILKFLAARLAIGICVGGGLFSASFAHSVFPLSRHWQLLTVLLLQTAIIILTLILDREGRQLLFWTITSSIRRRKVSDV